MKYKSDTVNDTPKVVNPTEVLDTSKQELECLIEAIQTQLSLAKLAVESMEKNLVVLIKLLNENNN